MRLDGLGGEGPSATSVQRLRLSSEKVTVATRHPRAAPRERQRRCPTEARAQSQLSLPTRSRSRACRCSPSCIASSSTTAARCGCAARASSRRGGERLLSFRQPDREFAHPAERRRGREADFAGQRVERTVRASERHRCRLLVGNLPLKRCLRRTPRCITYEQPERSGWKRPHRPTQRANPPSCLRGSWPETGEGGVHG